MGGSSDVQPSEGEMKSENQPEASPGSVSHIIDLINRINSMNKSIDPESLKEDPIGIKVPSDLVKHYDIGFPNSYKYSNVSGTAMSWACGWPAKAQGLVMLGSV